MHRIDGAGNVNGQFTEGDPAQGIQATVVTADWANALQEEIAGVIEQFSGALVKADNGQLATALLARFATIVALTAHTSAAAPHSGHATVAALNAHAGAAAPHSGHETPAGAQAKVNALAIGVGQSWQDVSGSRASGVEYTNSTGRPIMVTVAGSGNSASTWTLYVGSAAATVPVGRGSDSNAGSDGNTITAIVPAGHKYKATFTNAAIQVWSELR